MSTDLNGSAVDEVDTDGFLPVMQPTFYSPVWVRFYTAAGGLNDAHTITLTAAFEVVQVPPEPDRFLVPR